MKLQTNNPEDSEPPKGSYNQEAPEDRASEIRRDTDDQSDRSVDLKDVDAAMLHQFKERFDMSVVQNGERIDIPVIFDHPERWKWAADQDLKSAGDRILYPLMVINRESTETDESRDNPNKNVFNMSPRGGSFVAKQRWSQENRYDNFMALSDRVPAYDHYIVQVPNYINVSYSCTLYTEYTVHSNTVLERVNYQGRSYWGDPERWLFYVTVGSFDQTVEGGQDESQYVQLDFDVDVKAYVLPDESLKEETLEKMRATAEVQIEEEIVTEEEFLNG